MDILAQTARIDLAAQQVDQDDIGGEFQRCQACIKAVVDTLNLETAPGSEN